MIKQQMLQNIFDRGFNIKIRTHGLTVAPSILYNMSLLCRALLCHAHYYTCNICAT